MIRFDPAIPSSAEVRLSDLSTRRAERSTETIHLPDSDAAVDAAGHLRGGSAVEPRGAEGVSFEKVLGGFVHEASSLDRKAADAAAAFAEGRSDDLHGTMIAAKEAEMSLKLVGTVRNKLLDAFHELWRTNV